MTRSPSPLLETGIFFSVEPFDVSKWIDPVKAWSVTPVRKPVPSSIFLPLRLSWFLFSLGVVSSALIDFKIEVNELISLAFLSTSSWVELFFSKASADSNFLVASSINDFCFVLFLTLSNWDFNSSIFKFKTESSTTSASASTSFFLLSLDWLAIFSATAAATFSEVLTIFFSVGFTDVSGVIFALYSPLSELFAVLSIWATLSLASTAPAPKNNPTPIRTLAAPTLNFFME